MGQTAAQNTAITKQAAVAGNSATNIAANATTLVKSGAGVLASLNVNTVGVTSSVVLYDSLTASGKKLGTFSTLALGQVLQNLAFTIGLTAVTAGGTPADITIGYR